MNADSGIRCFREEASSMDGTAKCIFGRLHAQQRTDGKQDFSPVSFISLDPLRVLLKNLGSIHFHNPISNNPTTKRNPKPKTQLNELHFLALSQICNISPALIHKYIHHLCGRRVKSARRRAEREGGCELKKRGAGSDLTSHEVRKSAQ